MNTITITLSDERLAKLKEIAAGYNVKPEEHARGGVEELLSRPDDEFRRAVDRVLKKNDDLYRRLA